MKNYILAVFMVLCLTSVSGQEFLSIREDAGRREKVEMETNSAEAVFIAETNDIKITTSNKSVDLVSSPVRRDDGKYEYVIIWSRILTGTSPWRKRGLRSVPPPSESPSLRRVTAVTTLWRSRK